MNAIVRTANVDWEITEGKDKLTAYLTGGKYKNLEIINPANDPNMQVGGQVTFIATNNPENGSYRGDIVGTLPIESISYNTAPVRSSKKQLVPTGTVNVEQREVNATMPTYAQMQEVDVVMPTYEQMMQEQQMQEQQEINVTMPTYEQMMQEQKASRNPFKGIVSAVKEKLQPNVSSVPRKNPLSLLAAFAKGSLTYEYETTHGERFKLQPIQGKKEMLFSGSTFEGELIVERPKKFPTTGEQLSLKVTNDTQNGMYAGAPFLSNQMSNVQLSDENGHVYSSDEMGLEVPEDKNEVITLRTKNSVYQLERYQGRDDIMVLSGGQLGRVYQIETPKILLDENGNYTDKVIKELNERNAQIEEYNNQYGAQQPLGTIDIELKCTDNWANDGFPGIRIHPRFGEFSTEITRKAVHMEKMSVFTNSADIDFGSEMQKHIADIKDCIGNALGLPTETQNKVLSVDITPSLTIGSRDSAAQFNVAIGGLDYFESPTFDVQSVGFSAAQQYIQDELSRTYGVGCNFGNIQPVGHQELSVFSEELSQQALGLDKASQIRQHAATYVENTPTSPTYVKETPTHPELGPQLW